jgi:hypothetical protein
MASIVKRTARGKTVYGVRVRRKGQPLLTATFERLTDARQWAQRQEAAVSENRAAPGNAARKYTVGLTSLSAMTKLSCRTSAPRRR